MWRWSHTIRELDGRKMGFDKLTLCYGSSVVVVQFFPFLFLVEFTVPSC